MLGCAAEKAILIMINKYQRWLTQNGFVEESERFEDIEDLSISGKFSIFNKSLESKQDLLPKHVSADLNTLVESIFSAIENNIIDSDEVDNKNANKEELSNWINIFPAHCKNIYEVINCFE